MNAPLRKSDVPAAQGVLKLFALFHLNLAFSSIEEEQRADVIAYLDTLSKNPVALPKAQ